MARQNLDSTIQALASAWRWDEATQQYRDPRGRFVARATIRQALDQALVKVADSVRDVSIRLANRQITLAVWQTDMARLVKSVNLIATALAKGGWAQISLGDLGRLGNLLRRQYGFLDRFAGDVASGRQALDGSLVTRAKMYIEAARETYHLTEMAAMTALGYTETRRILGEADHCTDADGPVKGCVELAEAGWMPIDEMVPIGRANCIVRCHCYLVYRNPSTKKTIDLGSSLSSFQV